MRQHTFNAMAAVAASTGTLKEPLTQLRELLGRIAMEYDAPIVSTIRRFA